MITHYQGSKGPVAIATMPYPHLKNAHEKLLRSNDATRAAEIEAMGARLVELDAEHKRLTEERGDAGDEPADMAALEQAFIAIDNERNAAEDAGAAPIGHNNPPEPTTVEPQAFAAIRVHMDDLLIEVRNWADGATIESQAQADEVARLIEQVRLAEKAADDVRKEEVKPLDEQRDAIQARYNAYIAPLKNKVPGKLSIAGKTLKAALDPWLLKIEQENRERAERLRKEADEKVRAAQEAAQAAAASDFGAAEEAEDLFADAAAAQAAARRAETGKAHAHGDTKAVGLRSYFKPMLADPKAALAHYVKTQPEAMKAFLVTLAEADVRAGKRQIPGFEISEERRVA